MPSLTRSPFADSVDHDETTQNVHMTLDVHFSIRRYLPPPPFLTTYHTFPTFNDPEKKPLENNVGK